MIYWPSIFTSPIYRIVTTHEANWNNYIEG